MNDSLTYYSSGEFAAKAGVSLRTIRYYDKQNILKPSYRAMNGSRYYTDSDFAALQQILLWKYLGFSLAEIREMTLATTEKSSLLSSLQIQKKLVEERISEMSVVSASIDRLTGMITNDQPINWDGMMDLIHLTAMERSLREQYQDAANISSRISLHREYSTNSQGWFHWIFEQCEIAEEMNILEVGCGNGALWSENMDLVPVDVSVILSDISEGMVHDACRTLGKVGNRQFEVFDCQRIPYPDNSFDRVIAGHVFFYCSDIRKSIDECARVLKPGGRLICSTYGHSHMKEITQLVQAFDPEIILSADNLYERFGKENGHAMLEPCFESVEWKQYEDSIEIDHADPLLAYILSCHGNQNSRLLDRFKDFKEYVEKQVSGGFHITKDAGVFICQK